MNRLQYLLMKLAEESNEVAQIALKTAQFGLNEKKPGQDETNAQRTHAELNDLMAIVQMLNYEYGFDYTPDPVAIRDKKIKVNSFYVYSQNLGLVDTP